MSNLPLFHSCDLYTAKEIIKTGAFKIRECPVFKKELVYFYYGKPSYKSKHTENVNSLFYLPVSFICRVPNLDIFYLFPFDSGAYESSRYKNYVHHKMKKEDFALHKDLNQLPSFIECFFGSPRDYFKAKVCGNNENISVYWENFDDQVVESYNQIIRSENIQEFDDRAKAIEIIYECNIDFNDSVLACIMPDDFCRDTRLMKALAEYEIEPLTYIVNYGIPPTAYDHTVLNEAYRYLEEHKYFEREVAVFHEI